MVLDYFKLRENPFGGTPDARYLFLDSSHREALASLLYGVDAGCGLLAMIARPGLGKTTLLLHALNLLRQKALTVFLFQTVCDPMDLLRALLTGLGVQEAQGGLIQMQLMLKEVLVEQACAGKRVVVVIDEAQNLDDQVLELIRMLSNFETSREKLVQIILSGQPQLAETIGSPGLEQLRQRISIFACLQPFSREETQLYIEHRLRIAGYSADSPLFTRDALNFIADYSGGIPRNINNLCFNSLSLACASRRKVIDTEIVREVIADLDLGRFQKKHTLASRSNGKEWHAVPVTRSANSAPRKIAGWIPSFALAVAVALVLGTLLFAGRGSPGRRAVGQADSALPPAGSTADAQRAATAQAAGQAESVIPPLVAPDSFASDAEQATQRADPPGTISVTPGKTLRGICVENFGICNPELLEEIRRLNPWLNNLDHIEIGEKIRLPVSWPVVDEPGNSSIATRDTP
jgi:general secretion pathway protein A